MLINTLRTTAGRSIARQPTVLSSSSTRASLRPSFAPIRSNARSYASSNNNQYVPPPNTSARSMFLFTLVLGGLGAGAYYLSQQGKGVLIKFLPPFDLPSSPDHSVLAKSSLKEPGIHSSNGPSDDAKSVHPVHKKAAADVAAGTSSTMTEKMSEASNPSEGAFNEETGEINWDCPCLGGMADGPCGEDFKAAFSCFVFSEAEPKGMDCVEKFKAMQDCFREHPDVYGEEEIEDEDEESSPSTPAKSTTDSDPAHPIPGNPTGHTSTPRQREKGLPNAPTGVPPENSPVLQATPNNSTKKGPKHVEKSVHGNA